MKNRQVKTLIFTGYGLNCDYETAYSFRLAGAEPHRVHINELIPTESAYAGLKLDDYHIMVFGGGFSWADDHGAGVLMASKLSNHLGKQIDKFITDGKLVIGICNGFQTLVNLGLLPGFDGRYNERRIALTHNDSGNFVDTWVNIRINPDSPCVFTKNISTIELPVRHGEGKFYAGKNDIALLGKNNQITMQYADNKGISAKGRWPYNPNGSLEDIAGICDPSGRIFGLMPHPEAFNHVTNHPDWVHKKQHMMRQGKDFSFTEGEGTKIFRNAVEYANMNLLP